MGCWGLGYLGTIVFKATPVEAIFVEAP